MRVHSLVRMFLVTLAAGGAGLAVTTTPALARATHPYLPELQISGSVAPSGSAFTPLGVAVDNTCWAAGLTGPPCTSDLANGNVLVTDISISPNVVDRFAAGSPPVYKCQITGETPGSALECNGETAGSETTTKSFNLPYGVAVDERTGEVYVANLLDEVVDVFGPEGMFLHEFNGSQTPAGSFFPTTVGIDKAGDIYVVDVAHNVVDKFSSPSSTAYVCQITGEGVGSTSASECNKGTGASVPGGKLEGAFSVAIDNSTSGSDPSAGDVYVTDNKEVVDKFNSSGTYVSQFTGTGAAGGPAGTFCTNQCAEGVAVDQATHDVYVTDTGEHVIDEFNDAGGYVSQFAAPTTAVAHVGAFDPIFVAVDQATGDVYAGDDENKVVDVFGPQIQVVEAKTGGASTQIATATVKGEVNPEGSDASGFFEYGACETPATCASSPYGHTVNAVLEGTQTTDLGTGTAYVNVNAVLEGLQPHKTYHYRLVGHSTDGDFAATNTSGGVVSGEGTVTIQAIKPAIEGAQSLQAMFVEPKSVQLADSVNPENEPTEYRFEYGPCANVAACSTSSYPEATAPASAGEGYGGVAVYQKIEGLTPATVYHYKLVASNGQGPTESAQGTFTTPAEPVLEQEPETKAPSVTTGAVSAITAETATITGSVNPNAAPASYVFELGVYQGSQTQFGSVASGEVGGGAESVEETYQVANLQAGITYAYRIKATNSQGTSIGQAVTFATSPVPVLFTAPIAPALLATPSIAFPSEASKPPSVKPKALTRAQKLAAVLKACKQKHGAKRGACERQARRRYGPAKKKAKKR